MKDFVAIDFETANAERCSVCSVGIVIVKDGEIVDKFYSLIQPEPLLLLLEYSCPWTYTKGHDGCTCLPKGLGTGRAIDRGTSTGGSQCQV